MSRKLNKKNKHKKIRVVLIQSVNKNQSGEMIEVKAGYAAYLVRYGMAMLERGNEDLIKDRTEHWKKLDQDRLERAKADEERLKSIVLNLQRKSGTGGALYGSVTSMDVARELQALGCNIQRRDIVMDHIKTTGQYTIGINLHGGSQAKMQITVSNEAS